MLWRRDFAYFGNMHIVWSLDYAYFKNMHICDWHDYAYFRNMHILECVDYAYQQNMHILVHMHITSSSVPVLSTTFTSSYSAITGQTAISLILVLCTTVVLSAVPGSCIFMWIPLLENKKIRPAGLQWWPYQNKKQSSDFHLQHCLICREGWRI